MEVLSLARSFEEQVEYQANVPHVSVPNEVINQWEDWVHLPIDQNESRYEYPQHGYRPRVENRTPAETLGSLAEVVRGFRLAGSRRLRRFRWIPVEAARCTVGGAPGGVCHGLGPDAGRVRSLWGAR